MLLLVDLADEVLLLKCLHRMAVSPLDLSKMKHTTCFFPSLYPKNHIFDILKSLYGEFMAQETLHWE